MESNKVKDLSLVHNTNRQYDVIDSWSN